MYKIARNVQFNELADNLTSFCYKKMVHSSIFVTNITNVRANVLYLYKIFPQVTQLSRLIRSRLSGVLILLNWNNCLYNVFAVTTSLQVNS